MPATTLILYDILFTYLDDAIAAKEQGTYEEFRESAGKAGQVVHRLLERTSLTFAIAPSKLVIARSAPVTVQTSTL